MLDFQFSDRECLTKVNATIESELLKSFQNYFHTMCMKIPKKLRDMKLNDYIGM